MVGGGLMIGLDWIFSLYRFVRVLSTEYYIQCTLFNISSSIPRSLPPSLSLHTFDPRTICTVNAGPALHCKVGEGR